MNFTQALKMAAKSISANKGRSALTMLGVIIGLASVIILVSYAKGQNLAMQEYYKSMGDNKLSIYAYTWQGGLDVSTELYNYCLQLDEYVDGVTPMGQIYNDTTIKYGVQTLGGSNSDYNTRPTLYLGNDQFGLCNNYTLAKGRELSYLDITKSNQVCVLGAGVAQSLFNLVDPVGKTITINGLPFLVVGVYEAKGSGVTEYNEEGTNWQEVEMTRMDRIIVLPYTLSRTLNNNQTIDQYTVKAKDSESAMYAATLIRSFLKGLINENYGYSDVTNESVYQNEQSEANAMQQRFLGGIAAISLLVGGVGIMNIMLVTVTERTREIGIRKAIGAERKSIIAQFLIEAAMICSIGGLIGIAIGYVGTMVAGKLLLSTTTDVLLPSPIITLGAFLFSVALGVIFGMYPAVKASGLQPVVALRAE